jgi:hypothetical protein
MFFSVYLLKDLRSQVQQQQGLLYI